MNIRLLDNYELRRVDDRNWQLWQFKPVKKKDGSRGRKTGEVVMEWTALGIFPRTIEGAIRWIFENAPKRNWAHAECDLRGAIDELRELERDMAAHAEEFAKGVAR